MMPVSPAWQWLSGKPRRLDRIGGTGGHMPSYPTEPDA
jgi:hypothetical protein